MRLLRVAFALLCAVGVNASASTLTATLSDTDGTAWANATYTAVLQVPSQPGVIVTIGGVPVSPSTVRGTASSSGVISGTFTDTSTVDQKDARWVFRICPNASSAAVTVSVAIVGSTPNLTGNFTNLQAPRFPASPTAFGYIDAEVISPALGSTYFNVAAVCGGTSLRQYSNAGWTCGGGGSTNSNPITSGLLAEYPFNDGSGTTITDISPNGNNATFAAGVNSPTWLPYGVSFFNTPIVASIPNAQYATTPLSDWKTAVIGFCNPLLGQNTGTTIGIQIGNTPVLVGAGGGTGGVNIFTAISNSVAVTSTEMAIFRIAAGNFTAESGYHDGCHIYAISLDATADLVMTDGVAAASYKFQRGSSANSAITGSTYMFGAQNALAATALRGVVTYAVFYSAELTATQMQQVTGYVQQKLTARTTFPTYPQFTNSVTPQYVFAGDSLTAGFQGSSQWTTTLSLTNSPTITNWGIGSMKANDVCYNSFVRWASSIVPGSTVVQIDAGTNDMVQAGLTSANIAQFLGVCATNIKKWGGIPVVATIISRTGFDTQKNSLNNVIRAQYKQLGFEYLVDFGAFAPLGADGASVNTACFQGDGVHLTGPGVGTCGSVNGVALSGYGAFAAMSSNLYNYITSPYSTSGPRVLTATTALVAGDRAVSMGTLSATSAITLPDCSGLTGSSISINNPQAAQAVTVVGFSASQPINGLTTAITVPNNSRVTPTVVAGPSGTSGCSWTM